MSNWDDFITNDLCEVIVKSKVVAAWDDFSSRIKWMEVVSCCDDFYSELNELKLCHIHVVTTSFLENWSRHIMTRL